MHSRQPLQHIDINRYLHEYIYYRYLKMSIDIYQKKEKNMGNYKNKTYPLRLDENTMSKIRYIAQKEDRPISKQFERITKEYIKKYEQQHGEIRPDDNA